MKFTKENMLKALARAVRTFAQGVLSMITVGAAIKDIDWINVLSVAAVAAIYSLLMSVAFGIPETATDGELVVDNSDDTMRMLFNVETPLVDLAEKKSIRLNVVNGNVKPLDKTEKE